MSGLDARRAGPRQLVGVHADRRAFLESLAAVVRGERKPEHPEWDQVDDFREALLAFDEPLAFATLLEAYSAQKPDEPGAILPELVLDAGAIFAATTPADDSVRAAIAKLEKSDRPEQRFVGFCVDEELREPSFGKAPPELARAVPVVVPDATIGECIAAIATATGATIVPHADAASARVENPTYFLPFVASPWRALLVLACRARAQRDIWSVTRGERGFVFGPVEPDELASGFDSPENLPNASAQVKAALSTCPVRPVRDPRKALRALAAAQGCELREGPDHALSFEPRKSR
jgi:hypothetical protein